MQPSIRIDPAGEPARHPEDRSDDPQVTAPAASPAPGHIEAGLGRPRVPLSTGCEPLPSPCHSRKRDRCI
jgi:hypothetical protein